MSHIKQIQIFCGVKFSDKDQAKALGAKFDMENKSWYFQYEIDDFYSNKNNHTYQFKPHDVMLHCAVRLDDNRNHDSKKFKDMDCSYSECKRRYDLFMKTYKPIEPIKTIKQKVNVNDDPFLD